MKQSNYAPKEGQFVTLHQLSKDSVIVCNYFKYDSSDKLCWYCGDSWEVAGTDFEFPKGTIFFTKD